MRGIVFGLLLFGLLSASAFGQNVKKIALLAGVNEYEKPGFDTLHYAERDMEELGKELQKHGFQVVVMLGSGTGEKKATRQNILAKLAELVKPIGKDDLALVAFSGHGQQLPNPDRESKDDGFFCCVDAVTGQPGTQVSLSHVTDEILAKNGGRNMLLVDACRNVPVSNKGVRKKGVQGRVVELPEDTTILFSCRAGQESIESSALRHGLFTYCVLEGLRGSAAHNGEVDWDGLAGYVKRRMRTKEMASRIPAGSPQDPISAGGVRYTVLVPSVAPPASKPDLLTAPFSRADATVARAAWAKYLGRPETFKNSIGMEFVLVPPGEFEMGTSDPVDNLGRNDERPAHRVRITKPLYFGKYEITRGQFRAFVTATGYKTEAETDGKGGFGWNEKDGKFEGRKPQYIWGNTGFRQTDSHPVVNVTWNDAKKFCDWLNSGNTNGLISRLPTEAEWEYACRAGTTTRWFHGDDWPGLARSGNVADSTAKAKWGANRQKWPYLDASDGHDFTAPVGSFNANPFGLFDLHGNVWEWCLDWYDAKQHAKDAVTLAENPTGSTTEQQSRVLRGGSWGTDPRGTRSAVRHSLAPALRNDNVGFRLVFSPRTP